MIPPRPGLNPARLLRLMAEAVERCQLDLGGAIVLTEAATGAYQVTPVLAAMAGADVVLALTRPTRYGSVDEVATETKALARRGGVEERVEIHTARCRELVSRADIVTNSGHVRPIDAEMVRWLKPTCVIPLMYEAWEFRAGDLDASACEQRGILVGGTNERHPSVDVFSFLGPMAAKLLMDAGVGVFDKRILVLCDNAFAPPLAESLRAQGARIELCASLESAESTECDAVLVSLTPRQTAAIGREQAVALAERWPGAVVCQFWGDLDRSALTDLGVPFWPVEPPPPGHMGVLPSDIGPDPIVRLQAGGLKVGEAMWRVRTSGRSAAEALQSLQGDPYFQPLLTAKGSP